MTQQHDKNNELKDRITNNQKKWLKRHGESRKDKGDGAGSIILNILFEELCVTKLCEIWCETKLCVKDGVRRLRGRRRRRRSGIQNQKQEPHTKMWGKTTPHETQENHSAKIIKPSKTPRKNEEKTFSSDLPRHRAPPPPRPAVVVQRGAGISNGCAGSVRANAPVGPWFGKG